MHIIAFNGLKCSGKSTASDYFIKLLEINMPSLRVVRRAFADPMKEILSKYFGVGEALYTQEGKMQMNEFWGMTHREMLQKFGTEAMRDHFHPETWVKIMQLTIDKLSMKVDSEDTVLVIDDLRFDNEAEMLRKYGAMIVQIRRDAVADSDGSHRSEHLLPETIDGNLIVNFKLRNNGTIAELRDQVGVLTKLCLSTWYFPPERAGVIMDDAAFQSQRLGDPIWVMPGEHLQLLADVRSFTDDMFNSVSTECKARVASTGICCCNFLPSGMKCERKHCPFLTQVAAYFVEKNKVTTKPKHPTYEFTGKPATTWQITV